MRVVFAFKNFIKSNQNNLLFIRLIKALTFVAFEFLSQGTFANPQGGVVSSGTANISTPSNTVTQIQQSTNKAVIDWRSFNIEQNERVNFQQPSASSMTLNRIKPEQGVSTIYGVIEANGRIILTNPAGIWFGPTARVDVAALIATTASISDKDFMGERYQFVQSSRWHGVVINEGYLKAAEAGLVALIGPAVVNNGKIEANLGVVTLGAATAFTLQFSGNDMIGFAIDQEVLKRGQDKNGNELENGITHSGSIIADGGIVMMSAKAASNVLDNMINMKGYIQANSVAMKNGEIVLLGGNGNVKVKGELIASGKDEKTKGGIVTVTGKNILIENNTLIEVSGELGGGKVLVGHQANSQDLFARAGNVIIEQDSVINANALSLGDGGNISIAANKKMSAHGKVSARGGREGGNGGKIEMYSDQALDIKDVLVNTRGLRGGTGNWLLTGKNIFITADIVENDQNSYLSNLDIATNLASTNIAISTMTPNAFSVDINVNAPIVWYSSNTLKLDTGHHIHINEPLRGKYGSLQLHAANSLQSITTGEHGDIQVNNFYLLQGQWYQVTENLPSFSVESNFQIANGLMPDPSAQFIRAKNGNGCEKTPYEIVDVYGLQGIGSTPHTLGLSYKLANDIDASQTSNWNNQSGFASIGNDENAFKGQFDGAGFSVNDLTIRNRHENSSVGLFGRTMNARISHVLFQNLNIEANSNGSQIGGLVGYATGTTIEDINAEGMIIISDDKEKKSFNEIEYQSIGGIVGKIDNKSRLQDVTSSISITGYLSSIPRDTSVYMGGIVGQAINGEINHANSNGSINLNLYHYSGTMKVGGVVGSLDGSLKESESNGSIMLMANMDSPALLNLGGLIGHAYSGLVIDSKSTNDVILTQADENNAIGATVLVGGMIGNNQSALDNLVSSGNVQVTMKAVDSTLVLGGLIGKNSGEIKNANASGNILLQTSSDNTKSYVGGLVGRTTASSNIHNVVSSGNVTLEGIHIIKVSPQPTANMQDSEISVGGLVGENNGLITDIANKTARHGSININAELYHNENHISQANVGGLIGLNGETGSVQSVMGTSHLTLSINNFNSLVFTGGAVGFNQGGNLSGLASHSTINLRGINQEGLVSSGGLIGVNIGTVNNSYSKNPILITMENSSQGIVATGGLVGSILNPSPETDSILNSYSLSPIAIEGLNDSGKFFAGGLVGANGLDPKLMVNLSLGGFNKGGIIRNTWSAGHITGRIQLSQGVTESPGAVGGLIGYHDISGTIIDSFWDSKNSGPSNAIGVGLGTTMRIKWGCLGASCINEGGVNLTHETTFSNWNFSQVWGVVEGSSYPYLKEFHPNGAPRVISGQVPAGNSAQYINLVTEGRLLDSTIVGGNNNFYFLESHDAIPDGALLLTYLSGAEQKGNLILNAPIAGESLNNLNISANTLQIGGTRHVSLRNEDLAKLVGEIDDSDILYSVENNRLILGNLNSSVVHMRTSPNTIYHLDGEINFYPETSTQLTFTAPVTLRGNIVSSGDQHYEDVVFMFGDTTFAGNNITFSDRLEGTVSAKITAKNKLTFNGDVGNLYPLVSISASAANHVINSREVKTKGDQQYNAPVMLSHDVVFISQQDGKVNFGRGVIGSGNNLTVISHSTQLNKEIRGIDNVLVIGNGVNNKLTVNTDDHQEWHIEAVDEGSLHHLKGVKSSLKFSNIQNISGGSAQNTFILKNNSRISGEVSGGLGHTNILNYTEYGIPLSIKFVGDHNGQAINSNGIPVANFSNFGVAVNNHHVIYSPYLMHKFNEQGRQSLFGRVLEATYPQYEWIDYRLRHTPLSLAQKIGENIDEIIGNQMLLDEDDQCIECLDVQQLA